MGIDFLDAATKVLLCGKLPESAKLRFLTPLQNGLSDRCCRRCNHWGHSWLRFWQGFRADTRDGSWRQPLHADLGLIQIGISVTLVYGVLASTDVSSALASSWNVIQPYANNPLREASIAGTVRAHETVPATLTVGCRTDDDSAVMTASFVVPDTLDFLFGTFEGPGGVGESEELLSVTVGDEAASTYNVSGWHSDENQFTFSFLLPKNEASFWQERSSDELAIVIHLDTPDDLSTARLRAEFELPADEGGLSDVIAPCLEATVINQ